LSKRRAERRIAFLTGGCERFALAFPAGFLGLALLADPAALLFDFDFCFDFLGAMAAVYHLIFTNLNAAGHPQSSRIC
jgi:hypothetical protein